MVTSFLKEQCEKELLKYAVGQRIFCPMCERVMDYRTSVLLRDPAVAMCADCFEESAERALKRLDPDPYGYHKIDKSHTVADFERRKQELIDVDGRQLA